MIEGDQAIVTRLDELSADEIQRLWELYMEENRHSGLNGSVSDFTIWVEERN
jgi:hypothetical protein